MTRVFKMHRAGPARSGVAPLRQRAGRVAARTRSEVGGPPRSPDRLPPSPPAAVEEIGGPQGPEPTRYGDWERNGICYDF